MTQAMSRRATLAAIRGLHSAVFLVELVSILWIVITGLRGRRDRSVAVAVALVAVEGVVWVGNARICPLTPLAEHYGAVSGSVSDIFLPDPIARTIPQWSIPLITFGLLLHVRGIRRERATRVEGGDRAGNRPPAGISP